MKIVVFQNFVGLGHLGAKYNTKIDNRDNLFILSKCMKSVKNWCKKKGYEYILNTKNLEWDYCAKRKQQLGHVDKGMDLCHQRHELLLNINADYIINLDNDIWIYKDFELPKIENIGLCLFKGVYTESFRYPQTGVQFINGTANKHYNTSVLSTIKNNDWDENIDISNIDWRSEAIPSIWDGTNHTYKYCCQYPEKITWLDFKYNCIPHLNKWSGRYPYNYTEEEIKNSYLIHLWGSVKMHNFKKLPLNMQEEFNNI